jgi:metal-responsive CopG/Arc/MetJ family transcriptional regulator
MAKFTVEIDEKLAREFRHIIIDVYGTRRGALTKAVEEAIRLWIQKNKNKTQLP